MKSPGGLPTRPMKMPKEPNPMAPAPLSREAMHDLIRQHGTTYDAKHHAANAQLTRRARLAVGDLFAWAEGGER